MASERNSGLTGRIVDERGRPLAGLAVVAQAVNLVTPDERLGATRTDAEGRFTITYPPATYQNLFAWNPDVLVTVFDRAGIRELHQTPTFPSVKDPLLRVPDIVLPRAHAEGWAVTLEGAEPSCLSHGNHVEVLVDGEEIFSRAVEAIRSARESVHLLQFMLDPSMVATFERGSDPDPPIHGATIVEELLNADARGCMVRVLVRQNPLVRDSWDDLNAYFSRPHLQPHNVRLRRFPLTIHTMHAKILVLDEQEAFLLGPPVEQKYWDTPAHRAVEPRRGAARPLHDVSLVIRGPAVAPLMDLFASLWNFRSDDEHNGDDKLGPCPAPPTAGPHTLQVVRTLPKFHLPGHAEGECGVLEAYLRALSNARGFVYFENQYFTNGTITAAIKQAVEINPDLQVILLLNRSMDVPTYDTWQRYRLKELNLPYHPSIGVFTLASPLDGSGGAGIIPTYVHSKVGIVDDAWATVGTANLDGISLESAYEFGFFNRCNVDVNAVLFDDIPPAREATGCVPALRRRLWSEHLGVPESELHAPPPGGWLTLWRRIAQENARALATDPTRIRGHVFPLDPEPFSAIATRAAHRD